MNSPTQSLAKTNSLHRIAHASLLAVILSPLATLTGCNNAVQGGVTGAGVGALSGLAIGSLSGNAGKGAVIGAVAGAVGGAVIGDQNERRSNNGQSTGGF